MSIRVDVDSVVVQFLIEAMKFVGVINLCLMIVEISLQFHQIS